MSWDDMCYVFAAEFTSEIEGVIHAGGEPLLRERVAALNVDQRQLLREALDEAAPA